MDLLGPRSTADSLTAGDGAGGVAGSRCGAGTVVEDDHPPQTGTGGRPVSAVVRPVLADEACHLPGGANRGARVRPWRRDQQPGLIEPRPAGWRGRRRHRPLVLAEVAHVRAHELRGADCVGPRSTTEVAEVGRGGEACESLLVRRTTAGQRLEVGALHVRVRWTPLRKCQALSPCAVGRPVGAVLGRVRTNPATDIGVSSVLHTGHCAPDQATAVPNPGAARGHRGRGFGERVLRHVAEVGARELRIAGQMCGCAAPEVAVVDRQREPCEGRRCFSPSLASRPLRPCVPLRTLRTDGSGDAGRAGGTRDTCGSKRTRRTGRPVHREDLPRRPVPNVGDAQAGVVVRVRDRRTDGRAAMGPEPGDRGALRAGRPSGALWAGGAGWSGGTGRTGGTLGAAGARRSCRPRSPRRPWRPDWTGRPSRTRLSLGPLGADRSGGAFRTTITRRPGEVDLARRACGQNHGEGDGEAEHLSTLVIWTREMR